jgi:type VI secretion system protein ImpK
MQSLNAPEIARTWAQFRRFYAELAAVEHELPDSVTHAIAAAETPLAENGGDDPTEAGAAKGLSARDVFTRLHRTLGELGFGGGRRNYRGTPAVDAGYVMAALADEALLHRIDWPGRTTWETMLLEDALYGTRIAGEQIFTIAEEQASGGGTFDPGLALAILLALQLGFRGRWRGIDDQGALQRLRLRLYELLCLQPWSPGADWATSFAGVNVPPLTEARVQGLPPLRPWLTAIAAAVVVLVLVTHVIWYRAVHTIVERADQVVQVGTRIQGGSE